MEDTLYGLVNGNIEWPKLPDTSHFSASDATRSQAKQIEKAYMKRKGPGQIINEDKEALTQAQATVAKLDGITRSVESGNVTVRRGLNRDETKFVQKKDLLYRQFTKENKVTLQLVVPEGFCEKVLRLAYASLMTEY